MEVNILFAALAALILLAVTSMRYGVDSRDGFPTKEQEMGARGVTWSTVSAANQAEKECPPAVCDA